ncbi:2-oxoglutarate dehydrogenase E1 component [Candidatus Methylospira mobilis]|uniref:2-oxoglutarate dehydrogenase E1 component n=1 Tax=Candidatus Methylospira mobilis TaxID=1808979 RepID=A0A5Q0BCF8_9GAMM|nr:2-oxoglutarate dehydrogenase E1 component [Candidatus Methylospira mobilis]QFY41613.1 2-oxoglutarate dehydrogenase E1 component [Candidatus Methylospira mobilis]WNV05138.1 2-oxoglutarate dehydrogenase E1 component [Candidatus Methylospira mobilis]
MNPSPETALLLLQQLEDSGVLTEDNSGFIEQLYENYRLNPESVDISWRNKFAAIAPHDPVKAEIAAPSPPLEQTPGLEDRLRKQAAVDRLIRYYRNAGHQVADNNPLTTMSPLQLRYLDPATHGLTPEDGETLFYPDILGSRETRTLNHIIADMRATYCGSIGSEYTHIVDTEIRTWILQRLESTRAQMPLAREQKLNLLKLLVAAEGIEKYLHRKYTGQKRFSLEGAESLIPLLDALIMNAGEYGTREMIIGMAHRGRLNVLVNIMGKKPALLFQEFEESGLHETGRQTGDVKYHQGFSSDLETPYGAMHLALAFNPSHLEIIDPVVCGNVRARQDRAGENGENAIMPVLIHGDAAFAGQGVVMETLNMAETPGFTIGGTLHIVINNQIGFTTSNPFDARSTLNCTDVANMIQAPVFHVNADDPEAVVYAARLALDFRMKFKRDVVVDLIGYRRQGHNEADEPAVTQPLMYRFIRTHTPVTEIYAQKLITGGLTDENDLQSLRQNYQTQLELGENEFRVTLNDATRYAKTRWDPYLGKDWREPCGSRISVGQLAKALPLLAHAPAGFEVHPRVLAILNNRRKMAAGELALDWGYAENLAYATLLMEGHPVRISGQDVGRGTFFHRHAILFDQNEGYPWLPLQHLSPSQGRFEIYDSLLSEEGVLGFEYGYSTTEPNALVVWEAQFGDFANGAQVVIDQFISSGETKWGRLCSLVMLLPHGYEGQGPEHSSARLERYLQLCASQNIQVCVPTTPAQIFHLLRRQLLRPFRKPLIVLTPKSLLRHKHATSRLNELSEGRFLTVIGETDELNPELITRVILCSGKVYYDLLERRRTEGLHQTAILRIEQLYPFPREELQQALQRFPHLADIIWCQEEPENQGAWHHIRNRFLDELKSGILPRYAGRARCAAPSVGKFSRHQAEQKDLVRRALFG